MKRLLIYVILLTVLGMGTSLGAGEPSLSEAEKASITQALSEALQSKRITQQQYNQAISWVHATPCDGVDRELAEQLKAKLAIAIARQLRLRTVDVLQVFRSDGWAIVYVDTHVSDEPYLFYSGDPITATRPVTEWSGAAMLFETNEIERRVLYNAPGIPKRLASCFAWHVTLNRD